MVERCEASASRRGDQVEGFLRRRGDRAGNPWRRASGRDVRHPVPAVHRAVVGRLADQVEEQRLGHRVPTAHSVIPVDTRA